MQTRLAHPGVPLEQEGGAVAGGDRVERIGDRLERRLSLQEAHASAQGPATSVGRLPHRHVEQCTPTDFGANKDEQLSGRQIGTP